MDTTNSSEKPQRRVKHGQRPTEPLADWPAEFGAAGAEQPAATSGDAPADDQWMFDLAAEYESRGAGLYGPITFTAQQLPNFVQAVIERAAAPAPTALSYADAAQWARNNGLNVPPEWDARAAVSAATKPESSSLRDAVRMMGESLEANEWASHLFCDPDLSTLDAEISRLVSKASAAATKPTADAESAWKQYIAQRTPLMDTSANRSIFAAGYSAAATKPTADLSTKITDTDSARKFLVEWHLAHFPTDRTFARYIMGDRENSLAGDFAWQLAKALATKPASVPEGFVLAPKVATEAMRSAGAKEADRRDSFIDTSDAEMIYGAMLAAAPAAPTAAPADQAEKLDAERYRKLRDLMQFSEGSDGKAVMAINGPLPAPHHNFHTDWIAERFDISVNMTVDALPDENRDEAG